MGGGARVVGANGYRGVYDRPLQAKLDRPHDFTSLALIGQGSAALVYLVRSNRTGQLSALKVQRKDDHARPGKVERVQMEREVMVAARHPLVAPLHSAFQDERYLYLAMEYCPGGSLDYFVRVLLKRQLTEDEVKFYTAEIALGLEFLHSKGYVYRDLKAANVLVAASGHIKLTDFGIAECGKLMVYTGGNGTPLSPTTRVKKTPGLSRACSSPCMPKAPTCTVGGPSSTSMCQIPVLSEDESPAPPSSGAGAEADRCRDRRVRGKMVELFMSSPSGRTQTSKRSQLSCRRDTRSNRDKKRGGGGTCPRSEEAALEQGSGDRCRSASHRVLSRDGMPSPWIPSLANKAKRFGRSGEESLGVATGALSSSGGDTASVGGAAGAMESATERCYVNADADSRRAAPTESGHGQTSVVLPEVSFVGSPEYMAPEILTGEVQGSAMDWWGLGVLTYELLLGRTPFAGPKIRATYLNIMKGGVSFPPPGEREEGDLSPACQDLVSSLLEKDPRSRAGSRGAGAVKSHPFFARVPWGSILKLEPPLVLGQSGWAERGSFEGRGRMRTGEGRQGTRAGAGAGAGEGEGAEGSSSDRGVSCWGLPLVSVENTAGWEWCLEDGEHGGEEKECAEHHQGFERFDWTGEQVGVSRSDRANISLVPEGERVSGALGTRPRARGPAETGIGSRGAARAPVF